MWDEVLGHQQNKEFLQKLLKPGSRPHALFVLWYGRHWQKNAGPAFCKNVFMQVCGKKALRYLRELPPDGY